MYKSNFVMIFIPWRKSHALNCLSIFNRFSVDSKWPLENFVIHKKYRSKHVQKMIVRYTTCAIHVICLRFHNYNNYNRKAFDNEIQISC